LPAGAAENAGARLVFTEQAAFIEAAAGPEAAGRRAGKSC
jgi:hypothetical protein